MDKEWIHEQLREEIPYLLRHECTPRVMQVADALLDQLIEIERAEQFDEVFSGQAS